MCNIEDDMYYSDTCSIYKECNVHIFVLNFLKIKDLNKKISRRDILCRLIEYLEENKDVLKIENDKRSFKVINELRIFFENCLFVAYSREEYIYIPSIMCYSQLTQYIKYCIILPIDIYYHSEEDLINQKKFIGAIKEELVGFVLFPDHIDYWIHLGHDVNLRNFSNIK